MKKLYRSTTDRKVFGVCGGLAEYFEIDPTVVRVLMAVAICTAGGGLLFYLLMALIVPNEPECIVVND